MSGIGFGHEEVKSQQKNVMINSFVATREHQPTIRDEQEQINLHGMPGLPIYCTHSSKLITTVQCMDILLDLELSPDLVCTHMPFDVDCNSIFIVDMNKLSNPKDIACDDMGYGNGMAVIIDGYQLTRKELSRFWARLLKKSHQLLTITYGRGTMRISQARI